MNRVRRYLVNEKGLTLVEVMVSIVILGILTASVFSFMKSELSTFTFGSDKVKENAELRFTAMRFSDEIRNAFDVEVSDTVPSGDQKQYFYCDTSTNELMYDDDGTLYTYSDAWIADASFQIQEKTINLYDGDGNLEETVSIGYVAYFILTGTDGSTLESEVLLNNVPGDSVTSDLDTSKIYIGFNHDTP